MTATAVAVSVGIGVAFGLLPAIKATGAQVQSALNSTRGGTSMKFGGVWSVIIVLQVAFTVLCLPITIGASDSEDAWLNDVVDGRIYLGFHFRDGMEDGRQIGAERDSGGAGDRRSR